MWSQQVRKELILYTVYNIFIIAFSATWLFFYVGATDSNSDPPTCTMNILTHWAILPTSILKLYWFCSGPPGFASKQPWTSAPIVWLLARKMQCLSHPVLQLSPHSACLEYLLHVWWTTHCVFNQGPTASSPCQQNILRFLRCKILLGCAWKNTTEI